MSQWRHITIDRIEVRNFKRFYGTHGIDVRPISDAKPLILIGGDNGRGKTSIHEAVNYALYEDDDLPGITTRPNYLRAVSDRLNRRALDEGKNDYAVVLDLSVSGGDAVRQFRIERQWDVNVPERRVIRSILQVTENGRPLDWLDQDSPEPLQDFLRSTIPPRIAPFFFFDGERIQEFADEDDHAQRMIEAIEDILHINVYKALRTDLKKYVVDYIEVNEISQTETADFFELQQDAERIEADLDNKTDRIAEVDREIDDVRRERKRLEDELRRIASPHASKRDELLSERQRLEQELELAKADIQKGFEPLPILLAAQLATDLDQTLREEQLSPTTPESVAQIRQQIARISDRVFVHPQPEPDPHIRMLPAQTDFYQNLLARVAADEFGVASANPLARIHDIAEGERQRILARLTEITRNALLLRDAINRRERLFNDLRDVETKLQFTSDDQHVSEVIAATRAAAETIGRLEQEKTTVEADIQRLRADLAARQKQLEDRQRTRQATTEAKRVVKLGQEARRVLDGFIRELANKKLEAIS